ncbi:MAG: SH3 domain-containing protein [Aestuariivirga sp.]
MAGNRAKNRRIGSIILALACCAVAVATGWSLFGKSVESQANIAFADEITGSIGRGPKTLGPSGLPIPRFVSLKAEKVNVRRGPSSEHAVAWVFQRKGMPVEIVAEFENWRRIRDSDGEEGWILQNMLAGKRTAVVAPWRKGQAMPLHASASEASGLVARLSAGVVGEIASCTGQWCEIRAGGYGGWIEQAMLWGVYPGEPVD